MISYDWANDDSGGVFFTHGMISGLWRELVLLQGIRMKLKNKIMLQGCRVAVTGTLCWVYDVLGESYLACLSGLMGSKAGSLFSDP